MATWRVPSDVGIRTIFFFPFLIGLLVLRFWISGALRCFRLFARTTDLCDWPVRFGCDFRVVALDLVIRRRVPEALGLYKSLARKDPDGIKTASWLFWSKKDQNSGF